MNLLQHTSLGYTSKECINRRSLYHNQDRGRSDSPCNSHPVLYKQRNFERHALPDICQTYMRSHDRTFWRPKNSMGHPLGQDYEPESFDLIDGDRDFGVNPLL